MLTNVEQILRGQKIYLKLIFKFLIVTLFAMNSIFAQGSGKLTGYVVDTELGEGLIGVNVFLDGTTLGAATDIDGRYFINNVPVGEYNLVFSMIGYTKKSVTNVKIENDQTTKIDITLSAETYETDEVVITAKAAENSEAGLLVKRQKSISVTDAVSAEQFSRTGSGDAAEAIKQVVGASVVDGKYVYVRGLGDRYSSTQLNGAELPSSDPSKKAFQLDLLPTNLLENITTIKTFTPDRPGNFSGGIVDVATKKFPEKFTFKMSLSSTYNTNSSMNDKFVTYTGGSKDWLGYDDGTRALPTSLSNGTISKNDLPSSTSEVRSDLNGVPAQSSSEIGKAFGNIMDVKNEAPPVNQGLSLSVGDQIGLGGEKSFGYLGSFTYGRSFSFYDEGKVGIYKGVKDKPVLDSLLTLDDSQGTSETNLGGLFAFAFNLSSEHQIGGNVFYSRSGTSTGRIQSGYWLQELGRDRIVTNRILSYLERDILSYQVRGEHYFSSVLDATIDWSASISSTTQDEPDRRLIFTAYDPSRDSYVINGSNFDDPSRYFRDLKDNNNTYNINLQLPFGIWSNLKANFKTGFTYQYKDRVFNERIFSYIADGRKFNELDGDLNALFAADNFDYVIETDPVLGFPILRGNIVVENTKLENNYSGDEKVSAFFGMIDLPITRNLRFIGGARYETTDIELVSKDTTKEVGKIDEGDFLPSVNLIYSLNSNMNLRASFTQTLARPNFREIAPFSSKEFVNGFTLVGNPNLNRTLIQNYDLRWEWFTGPGQIIAISGFYKKLTDPIERSFIGQENNRIVSYENVDKATILGAEFEARYALGNFADFLENFFIGGNLSIVKSEIKISEDELEIRRAVDPGASDTRELEGQSPFILNLDLTYSNYNSGTTVSLNFNTFAERLSRISRNFTPDVYEQPAAQLDFVVSQDIISGFNLKFAVKNLLDSSYKEVHHYRGDEYIFSEYKRGRSFNVGVSYSL